jgi:hypothetical protein
LDAELSVDAPEHAVKVTLTESTMQAAIRVGEVRFITSSIMGAEGRICVFDRAKQA